jgi:non-ribosomal peptide synthetase-like protein
VAIPLLVLIKMAQWLAPFFTYHFFTGDENDSVWFAVAMSVLAFAIATLAEFAIAWAGKWLVAGRLKPGRYPLWGWTYFRWWFADRLVEAVPIAMITGSSLHPLWLRALGAKVGLETNLGSMTVRARPAGHRRRRERGQCREHGERASKAVSWCWAVSPSATRSA